MSHLDAERDQTSRAAEALLAGHETLSLFEDSA